MKSCSCIGEKILLLAVIAVITLAASFTFAAPTNSITLTIDTTNPGVAVNTNFLGLSVSSFSIDGDSGYTKFLTTANTQVVNLFKQIGIKHIRTIMDEANSSYPDPSNSQIDAFFDFAAAAGVNKIIWSLHLYDAEVTTNWSNNKAVAAHIWTTTTAAGTVESNLLESFAFDNEPDWLRVICCKDPGITGYYTPATNGGYIGWWKTLQQGIAAITPGAKFSGPDTGSKWPCPGEINTSVSNVAFTKQFAADASNTIAMANQHFYGQTGISNFTALQLAQACLSSNWLTTNYNTVNSSIVGSLTVPYRFTECSAFDNETNSGNHIFAIALWAVDFFHWWARHGCAGVDPFTRTVQYNSAIYYDGANYSAVAYAYGMKAFGLGSTGNVIYTSKFLVNNPSNINVTAYGVVNSNHLYVTVVNKTFDDIGSQVANVSIPAPNGFTVQSARYIVLSGGATPGSIGNATQTGACLGGAEIPNDGSNWSGTWTNLPVTNGAVSLLVQPTTAVVIDLQNFPQLSLGSPPLDAAGLHLSASAPPGTNLVVQVSTDLANWSSVYTNSGSFAYTDANATSAAGRFYRLWMP